jgi:hypothetical protein
MEFVDDCSSEGRDDIGLVVSEDEGFDVDIAVLLLLCAGGRHSSPRSICRDIATRIMLHSINNNLIRSLVFYGYPSLRTKF